MKIEIRTPKGQTLASLSFQKGQEYYAWEVVKDFCRAHQGENLWIGVEYSEE